MKDQVRREIRASLESATLLAEMDPQARARLEAFLGEAKRLGEVREIFRDDPDLLERLDRVALGEGSQDGER